MRWGWERQTGSGVSKQLEAVATLKSKEVTTTISPLLSDRLMMMMIMMFMVMMMMMMMMMTNGTVKSKEVTTTIKPLLSQPIDDDIDGVYDDDDHNRRELSKDD